MAVVLYRGKEILRVNPLQMKSYIKRGWALNKEGKIPGDEPKLSDEEQESNMLREMNILPSLANRMIGATAIPV